MSGELPADGVQATADEQATDGVEALTDEQSTSGTQAEQAAQSEGLDGAQETNQDDASVTNQELEQTNEDNQGAFSSTSFDTNNIYAPNPPLNTAFDARSATSSFPLLGGEWVVLLEGHSDPRAVGVPVMFSSLAALKEQALLEYEATVAANSEATEQASVDIDELAQSYRDKKASVLVLDLESLGTYKEGTILKKGSNRFGVFSVTANTPQSYIEYLVSYFDDNKVDFIVTIVESIDLVAEVEGIDIVISTRDEGLFVMGETIDSTFYVDSPERGSAGVVFVSPSNVVSAKAVSAN